MARRKRKPVEPLVATRPCLTTAVHLPVRPMPAPRSTRASWWRREGRVGRYASWRDDMLLRLGTVSGVMLPLRAPLQVTLVLHEWLGGADLDNYAKAVLDALQRAGWIMQDNCKHLIALRAILVESKLLGVTVVLREVERVPRWAPGLVGLPEHFDPGPWSDNPAHCLQFYD